MERKMSELTREEAYRLHQELWNWLANNPGKMKAEWLGWKEFSTGDKLECSFCFACAMTPSDKVVDEFDGEEYDKRRCSECLLLWPEDGDCNSRDGYYHRWAMREYINARKIANLPMREVKVDEVLPVDPS